jgi:hypothetical protein
MNEIAPLTEDQVLDAAEAMLKLPQVACPVRHMFAPGQYIRELCMPAGTVSIGYRQRFAQLNVIVKGRCRLRNDDGTYTELAAPMVYVGPPGRKMGIVLEDIQWLNIYATEETDVEKLEAYFLDKTPDPRLQALLLTMQPQDDDYQAMLIELGVSEAQVRAQSEDPSNQCPFPHGTYCVKVGASRIQGQGLIATADIKAGDFAAPALWDGKRTPAGRYINHAHQPNAEMVEGGPGRVWVRALRDIAGCRGGQDGEEITVNYRQAVAIAQRMRSLQ